MLKRAGMTKKLWVVCVSVSVLGACGGAELGSDEGEPIDETSQGLGTIGNEFANTSPYCPPTSDWSAWGQTPLSTWDNDVEPMVSSIINLTGVHSTTYVGHDPTIGRAADWRPHSREEGTRLANWFKANARTDGGPLGIQYIVWQGQIFNIARAGEEVRMLENRANFTQNHCDHVHVTFVPHGAVRFEPGQVARWNGDPVGSDGCTAVERANAAKFGCQCVNHKGSGGFCPGSGCTALETANAAKFGCNCVDHKGAGGFCPGTGCTFHETLGCQAKGQKCSLHACVP